MENTTTRLYYFDKYSRKCAARSTAAGGVGGGGGSQTGRYILAAEGRRGASCIRRRAVRAGVRRGTGGRVQ